MPIPAGVRQACHPEPVPAAMGQQTTMNAHGLENHVLKRLTALRPGWTVRKGPEPFQLTIRRVRETDLRFNLDSFYQQYREQPSALDRLFAARLRRLDPECDSEALFRAPPILPVLRPASFLDSAVGPVGSPRVLTGQYVTLQ